MTQAINGGRDPGAVGLNGTFEKDIVLAISRLIQRELTTPTTEVRLTRDTDVLLTLTERARRANVMKANAFVSVHCNAAVNRQAHGFEVFTAPGQNRGDVLAERIIEEVAKAFPAMRMRVDMLDGDRDKEARFTVLTRAQVPAALVEILFISNPTEEALLNDPKFQDDMAEAITNGIARFLGVKRAQPPLIRKSHTVVSGDTLWGLSRRYGVTVAQLNAWNSLRTNLLTVGQILFIEE